MAPVQISPGRLLTGSSGPAAWVCLRAQPPTTRGIQTCRGAKRDGFNSAPATLAHPHLSQPARPRPHGPHPHQEPPTSAHRSSQHAATTTRANARGGASHYPRRDFPIGSFPSHSHVLPTPGGHSTVELYGNYSISGPASIRKAGASALVANLEPLGQIDALEGGTCDTLSCETLECNEEQPCSLVAEHVELQGNFHFLVNEVDAVNGAVNEVHGLVDDPASMQGVHALGDKIVLTVSLLPDNTEIVLEAGGHLNHPVTVRH